MGGQWVSVTAIISDPAQDPHSFEVGGRTLLAVRDADLLIENRGGYDPFMSSMIANSGTTAPIINAVGVSGHTAPPGGDLNAHVWYDLDTAKRVADAVAAKLGKLDPGEAARFQDNARRFDAEVDGLIRLEDQTRRHDRGIPVSITEPVPVCMLDVMGLVNKTPAAFSRAIEEGTDVAVRTLAETLKLCQQHTVRALIYNAQTSGPVTQQVLDAARQADIAVVPVTETVPPGLTYLTWMRRNITAISSAVNHG